MPKLFLLAHVAGQDVAILSDHVESVVDIAAVAPVPRTSRAVCGLAALRSRVVTVIDTALAIDPAGEPCRRRRAVVTQVEGHHYALLVDMLDDAYRCEVRPLSSGLMPGAAWGPVVSGVIDHLGRAVLVLDLSAVVARAAGGDRVAA
ncbi:MAG: chemotaxis protein CheW [Sphingomonas paucimobilis]